MTAARAAAFRRPLLKHYDAHRREMPWRGETDPYRIWVSEVMLQQTRVETVRDRYGPFLEAFPDLAALANATEAQVLKAWEGLGYYSRARNLLKAAAEVVRLHEGALPDTEAALRTLPGFGPYTAAAVASIAFHRREAVLDGNVIRVLARVLDERRDVGRADVRRRLAGAAARLLDPKRPGDWNQALMDLGATLCAPKRPRCAGCPLARGCLARAAKTAPSLPRKRKRAKTPHFDIAAGLVWRRGRLLIARRPSDGLLGGLWEFPGGKRRRGESLEAACIREVREETGLCVAVVQPFLSVEHAFSHFRITLHTFHCRVLGGRLKPNGCEDPRFVTLDQLSAYAFPRATTHVLDALQRESPRGRASPRPSGTTSAWPRPTRSRSLKTPRSTPSSTA